MDEVKCPACKKGKAEDGFSCAYCGGEGVVTSEARRQWQEFLLKEPLKPETIERIFKPIKEE